MRRGSGSASTMEAAGRAGRIHHSPRLERLESPSMMRRAMCLVRETMALYPMVISVAMKMVLIAWAPDLRAIRGENKKELMLSKPG